MPLNAPVCKRHRRRRRIGVDLLPKSTPATAPEASGVFAVSSEGSRATVKTSWPAGGPQRPARGSGTRGYRGLLPAGGLVYELNESPAPIAG
jgi:hypothetical protein